MRIALHHVEGTVEKLLDSRQNCACPQCGTPLVQKKTRPSKVFEDSTTKAMYMTVHRYFTCPKCGYRNKSTEWRPVGSKACCEASITESNYPNASRILVVDGALVWERRRSALCLCGNAFAWQERMVLDGK